MLRLSIFNSSAICDEFYNTYCRIKGEWCLNDMNKRDLPNIKYKSATSGKMKLDIKADAILVTATLSAKPGKVIDHKHNIKITLYSNSPYADITWQVSHKKPNAYPEGGWICLPFNVYTPQYRLGRLAGILDPPKDLVFNTYKDMFDLTNGMAIFNSKKQGVGISAQDSILTSIGEPGLWKVSKTFDPKEPTLFVNLYNNMWGTNFRQWIGGSWSSSVRIWSYENFDSAHCLITPSVEARTPVIAGSAVGTEGELATIATGLTLSQKGILVTALGPNPDGEGTILRLWEQAGKSGDCTVKLPIGFKAKSIQPMNLRGEILGAQIQLKDSMFKINIKAYSPYSFLIRH